MPKPNTIDGKILNELVKRRLEAFQRNPITEEGGWVSTYKLGKVSNSFATHSSISRLRKLGFDIESRRSNNPKKKGWFRISY